MPDDNHSPVAGPGRHVELRQLLSEDPARLREALVQVARLAATTLEVPLALVSIEAGVGPRVWSSRDEAGDRDPGRESALLRSLCGQVVRSGGPLTLEDARGHPLARGAPERSDGGMRAFAAVPLPTGGVRAPGALCAVGDEPRAWTARHTLLLEELARLAARLLDQELDAAEVRSAAKIQQLQERAITAVTEGILIADARRKGTPIVFVNPGFERLTGYTAAEVLGKDLRFPCTRGTDPKERSRIEDALGRGVRLSVELRACRKDRSPFWNRLSITPIRDEAGTVTHFASIHQDVTRLKRVQEHLAVAEARYRRLVKTSPVGIYALDAEGRCTEVNLAMSRIVQRSGAELTGIQFTDVVAPEDRETARQLFTQMLRGTVEDVETELWVVRPSGERRRVAVSVTTVREAERIVGTHGIVRDITQRRAAEAALRESEERFRALFHQSPVGVFFYDRELRISEFNQRFVDLLGSTREALIGFDIRGAHDTRILPTIEAALAGREGEYEGPYDATLTDAQVWISMRVAPLRDAGGSVVGGIGIVEDITEHKRVQGQLRQSQKMEAVGRLAGGIAHDFNNMLTAISGNTQLLLLDLPADDPMREGLEEIRAAVERSTALTRQLLAFSRKQILQPRVLDLNEVVSGMGAMLRRVIGEDVQFQTILDQRLPPVHADPGQVEQVLLNLVVNARDAMPTGGRLTIETRTRTITPETARVHGVELPPGPYAWLSVSDTGVGMDEPTRARAFEPFFTTKEVGQGTGLGLSTVYGIVKQSGGYVWVTSEPGAGSTFEIYLPATEVDEAAEQPRRAVSAPTGGRETVLLVEDEAAVRALVHRVLTNAGYAVLEAENGPEALALAEAHPGTIDLVVTDVVMPRMSGKTMVEKLPTRHHGVRVLYMSGYTDAAIVHHGVLAPGTEFLQKPFRPDDLLRRVRQILDA